MDANLARNLASREGNAVAVYNRSRAGLLPASSSIPTAGFVTSESIDDFVATPRGQVSSPS